MDYPNSFAEYTVLEDEWYCEYINGWTKEERKNEIIKNCKKTYDVLKYPDIFRA